MLAFIVSLRHPQLMRSAKVAYENLERTLRSVCSQTSPNFKVFVVCHSIPPIQFHHPQLEFLVVNFDPLVSSFDELRRSRDKTRLDKGRKYLEALCYMRSLQPTHFMCVDADDYISKRIVETVEKSDVSMSWVINSGYVFKKGCPFVYRTPKPFNDICGTSLIFNYKAMNLPLTVNDVDEEWMKRVLGSHRIVHDYLREKNIFLHQYPGPGAIYVINTGENRSGSEKLRKFFPKNWRTSLSGMISTTLRFHPISKSIRDEFTFFE